MQLYTDYIAYFKNIAETHPEILHQGTSGNRGFAINIEEALSNTRTGFKEKGIYLQLIDYSYSFHDNQTQNARKIITGGFMVTGVYKKNDYADYTTVTAKAEKIVDEIVERMVADSQNAHPLFYHSLDNLENVDIVMMPAEHKGNNTSWLCTFTIAPFYENCIDRAGAPAWTDGGITPY